MAKTAVSFPVSWYDEHWKEKETDEFNEWWLVYYGPLERFKDEIEGEDEFYMRKAFALMGWLGCKGELIHASS